MIYDCFTFFNELDLLEIRLNELAGAVDRFVLVEAPLTHNGDPKPLHYAKNKARFAAFNDRIIHVVVRDFNAAEQGATFDERAWMRESIQRNAIARGLADAAPDDLAIVSDLDEIPRAESVRRAAAEYPRGGGAVYSFSLRAYNFKLNLRNVSAPVWGNDPKMADVRTFNDPRTYDSIPYAHFIPQAVNRGATATRFRYARPDRTYRDAGWHFSYLGDARAIARKIKAFNENRLYEMKPGVLEEHIRRMISSGKSLAGGHRFMPEPLDGSFPAFVLANRGRFAPLVAGTTPEEYARKRFLRAWFRAREVVRARLYSIAFNLTPKCVRRAIKRMLGR